MEAGDDSDFDDLMFLRDVVASWPALHVDDGDSSTSSSDYENSSPAEAVRERVGFKRRPRFNDKEDHERWYGEWGTGFWHQYVDPEAVERNDLLKNEFHQRFRIPHELFCTIYDEMAESLPSNCLPILPCHESGLGESVHNHVLWESTFENCHLSH